MRQAPQVTNELKETRSGWNYLEIPSQTVVPFPYPRKCLLGMKTKALRLAAREANRRNIYFLCPRLGFIPGPVFLSLGARALEPTSEPDSSSALTKEAVLKAKCFISRQEGLFPRPKQLAVNCKPCRAMEAWLWSRGELRKHHALSPLYVARSYSGLS